MTTADRVVARRALKPKLLFVGAFVSRPAVHGGQLAACQSLMRSSFADAFDFVLVDSTATAIPPPPVAIRGLAAAKRLTRFVFETIRARPDAALIFLTDGLGFAEKGLMALVAKAVGVRVVIAPRSGFLAEHYARFPLLRRLIRRVFGRVDVIVCQSRYWAETFPALGAVPATKCVVLKNWIEPAQFDHIPALDPAAGPLRLGFLGWVERSKGIFDLIEAVARLRGGGRDILLQVAGNGRDFEAAAERARSLGVADAVLFSGWISGADKLAFLDRCQIVVLPSYAEGMPNTLLESMAAGRPVIATTVGGIPDVLEQSGAGILHAPGDVEAIAAAIARYDDDRAEMAAAGVRARAVILRDHSVENAATALQAWLTAS
jgi:glycosyltransferase involved in cell wall biosynthesis